MSEYITISSAVNVLSAYGGYSLEDAERIAKRNCGPYFADVIEVVRCKSCKYGCLRHEGSYDPSVKCKKWDAVMNEDDYCSRGKKKTKCSGDNCPMQYPYDVEGCQNIWDCMFFTPKKDGVE